MVCPSKLPEYGQFSWVENAEGDVVSRSVDSNCPSLSEEELQYGSFCRKDHINGSSFDWDFCFLTISGSRLLDGETSEQCDLPVSFSEEHEPLCVPDGSGGCDSCIHLDDLPDDDDYTVPVELEDDKCHGCCFPEEQLVMDCSDISCSSKIFCKSNVNITATGWYSSWSLYKSIFIGSGQITVGSDAALEVGSVLINTKNAVMYLIFFVSI